MSESQCPIKMLRPGIARNKGSQEDSATKNKALREKGSQGYTLQLN